jgi:DNA primase
VFKFVQETEKLGFLEAAELLSRRAGIPIPERRTGERSQRGPLFDALEAAAAAYEQWLGDPGRGLKARAYLEGRKLSRETIREFRLGLAMPGWENLAQRLRERFGDGVLVQAGLAARRETGRGGIYDRFRNRLIVPLIAPGGRVVGFGARALDPGDEPKYLNSPETPVYQKGSFLYAFEQARRHVDASGEVVLVEGYFDAMALHQAGIRNTVATSGTALTTEQARHLRRAAPRVALTYDGDQAGQEAMMRSLGILLAEGLEVAVVELPGGQDPDSLVRGGGVEAWLEARRGACDPVEFIQRHGLRQASAGSRASGSGDPRERALGAVVRLAAGVQDPIRLGLLLERASQVFGFAEPVLNRAVELKRSGQLVERPLAAAVREERRSESHVERELLQALLRAPETLEEARRQLSPEDFRDPSCASIASWLWSGEGEAPADPAAGAVLRELLAGAAEDWDWARVAEGGTRRLIRRRLERQYRVAQQRILELQRQGLAGDPETVKLLEETQELARSISELNR